MSWLILPEEKLADLEALNAAHTDRKCAPIATADNTLLTGADKLYDPYWSGYHEFLNPLEPFEGEPVWLIAEDEE